MVSLYVSPSNTHTHTHTHTYGDLWHIARIHTMDIMDTGYCYHAEVVEGIAVTDTVASDDTP
jgi:hypothetical protein